MITLEELMSQAFWIGLLKIIGVNIILSGDNAVVIALAARSLPAKQQKQAIIWGSAAAIVMRVDPHAVRGRAADAAVAEARSAACCCSGSA